MSIYFGNDTVNDLYIGLTPVTKGYVGTHLFYNGDNTIIDLTYEKYILNTEFSTLYNTAEKPVKSAILKGQTLVNISPLNGEITIAPGSLQYVVSPFIKSNTTFTISFNCLSVPTTGFIEFRQVSDNTQLASENINVVQGYNRFKVTTVNKELNRFRFKNDSTSETDFVFNNLMIIEGDYTNKDIPYFEGMKSVQMPVLKTVGKNLFDGELEYGILNANNGLPSNSNDHVRSQNFIPINCETITFTVINGECGLSFYYYDKDKNFISSKTKKKVSDDLSIPEDVAYLKFRTYPITNESVTTNLNTQIQIEEGDTATEYKSYKSTAVTCNDEVELRGIGEVKDELNLVTGEKVEYVGEIVLDGNQDGGYDYASDASLDLLTVRLPRIPDIINTGANIYGLLSDKYASVSKRTPGNIYSYNGRIMLTKSLSELESFNGADKIKSFLSKDPITLQYPLATPVIKTVDISTVNQNGNDTELSTFNDLTHVTLSSEGLIPEAELEVATKNEEVLNTMSLEMDDISTTQNVLQETSNTQSENVDATMIATTEIYEQLL